MQTFHRDVKPANVLLTLQHGPQLLDFNLADSPHSAHQAQAALHGGTLPYMAPEQIEAFLDPELWGKVEAKADIYSLGLVFRELLTGQMPELPPETLSPQRPLRNLLDRRPFLEVSVRPIQPHDPLCTRRDRRQMPGPFARRPLSRCPSLGTRPGSVFEAPAPPKRGQSLTPRTAGQLGEAKPTGIGRKRRVSRLVAAALLYPPIAERLKPSIETLPDFQSAIDKIDEEEYEPAVNSCTSSRLIILNPHF